MMSQTAIHADLEAEFAAVAADVGCELAHVEWKGGTLRVVLDRPDEAVTVDHCAKVSRQISALLDVHDFAPAGPRDRKYLLEVSSPGLDRKLYRPEDYERFRGRLARVTRRSDPAAPSGGGPRTFVARLAGLDREAAGGPEVSLREDATGEILRLPLTEIRTARLEVEL